MRKMQTLTLLTACLLWISAAYNVSAARTVGEAPQRYEVGHPKNPLLRQRASYEPDATVQKTLIAEAEANSAKADELAKRPGLGTVAIPAR